MAYKPSRLVIGSYPTLESAWKLILLWFSHKMLFKVEWYCLTHRKPLGTLAVCYFLA